MRRFVLILSFLSILFSCEKEPVTTDKLITYFSVDPKNIEANGSSILNITCKLNVEAHSDKREVVLKVDKGQFAENKEQKITKKAEFENGELVIRAQVLVPMRSGTLLVTAEPNLPDVRVDYIARDSVMLEKSVPIAIKASSSSFYIWNSDNKSELTLTGTLSNRSGDKVSTGNKVIVEDYYTNGRPVGGRFRETLLSSNADSKVSTIYSSVNAPVGSDIYLKLTILDENGIKTNIKDSVLVTVKP